MTVLTHSGILAGRALLLMRRNPGSILSALVFPLLFFALFNLVMRRVMAAQGFDYEQLLPSTIVVQAMFCTGMASSYFVTDDRISGLTNRLRSLPIGAVTPMLGRAGADAARATASATVVLAVGVAFGMRFTAGWAWVPVYLFVAAAFAVALSLVFGMLGYIASSPDAAVSIASIPYLPLLMLSSGFAPLEDFPDWLEPIVRHQPVTAQIDALRALAGSGDIGRDVPIALAWSAGLAAVFAVLGGRAMRRSTTS